MIAYLNIGTNLGDKQQNIAQAINLIELALGNKSIKSSIVESEAWGYESVNSFLNIGIAIETDYAPTLLLSVLKDIEHRMGSLSHRTEAGEYADRLIDIDIMDIDGVTLNSDILTIPHPHLYDRPFFLNPYRELRKNFEQ